MKKLFLFSCLAALLCSCTTFTDDKTYYGTIIFINSSDLPVSIEISGSKNSDAKLLNGTIVKEISVNDVRELNVSWTPGDYTVIVVDGADENDAHAQFDYKITSENTLINNTGMLNFQINKCETQHLSLYKMPVKTSYTYNEYKQLLNKISLEADKKVIADIYFDNVEKSEYVLNWYTLTQNTNESNKNLFMRIEDIFKNYEIIPSIIYYCINEK